MSKSALWTTVSSILLASLASTAAEAQTATTEDVVITGSRIIRRDLVAPTPIVTASQEALQQSGAVNLEAAINQLPQFVPAGGANNGGRGGGQRATLNLRGLGTQRALVLMDGRRLPPSDSNGVVDINNIPQSIIESVETITGGASAIYGSDAISGVVNFKTKRNFEGMQVDAQYGNTEETDRQSRDINVTMGGNFAEGRGNAVVSFGYSDRQRLPGYKREFNDLGTLSSFLGYGAYVAAASNLPNAAAVNTLFQSYGVAGTTSNNNNFGINDDGTLFTITGARNYRGIRDGEYVIFNGDVRYPFAPTLDALSAQERRAIFGKAHYDLTDNLTLFATALWSNPVTDQDDGTSLTQFGTLNTVPITNPFIPTALRNLLATRPTPGARFDLNARYSGFPHKGWTDEYQTMQFVGGLRGNVGIKDWTFELSGQSDRTEHIQTQRGAIIKSKIQQLLDAPDGGNSICAGGYNPFGNANALRVSPQCIAFATTTLNNLEDISQDVIEGTMNGSLFDLPAGPLQFSLVASKRTNEYKSTPDFMLREAGTIEASNATAATYGKIWVSEIAGEVLVPVLRDVSFAQRLNLGLAYRYSDYNLSGGSSTYKADIDYAPIEGIMFRSGYARAVRAPNVGELYLAPSAGGGGGGLGSIAAGGGDPCDVRTVARRNGGAALRALCIATGVPANIVDTYTFPTTATGSLQSGNPNLMPETADTFTAGLVLRSNFDTPLLSNASISVDYYDIRIKDIIGQIGANVLPSCYNVNGFNPSYSASTVYCGLVARDVNGQLVTVTSQLLNLGGRIRRGVDIAIDWRYDIGPGTAKINVVASHIIKDASNDFPTLPKRNLAGTNGNPDWSGLTTFGYEVGPVDMSLRWRYIDGTKHPTFVTSPTAVQPGTKPYNLFDLVGSFDLRENVQLRGGVTNLLNQDPLIIAGTPGNTNTSLFDILGRSYYLALRAKF